MTDPRAGAPAADPRLPRLLGAPELACLVARVRRRAERGLPLTGIITLAAATPAQRDAVDRLLGRRARDGNAVSVRLDDVDALTPLGCAPGGPAVSRRRTHRTDP